MDETSPQRIRTACHEMRKLAAVLDAEGLTAQFMLITQAVDDAETLASHAQRRFDRVETGTERVQRILERERLGQ